MKRKGFPFISVGSQAQRCKECHDFQARACEADGKVGLFLRWIEEDQTRLVVTGFVRTDETKKVTALYNETGSVPPGCGLEKIRRVFALVEYADGSVGRVDPEHVTFLDRKEGKE